MASMKKRVYEIIEVASEDDRTSRRFDTLITALIVLNVLAVVFESVEDIGGMYSHLFYAFEVFSVAVFSVEYALRLWTCDLDERFASPLKGRLAYMATPLAIIDLMAIMPFFAPMMLSLDLRSLRVVRLFRIFRVFKVARYSSAVRVIAKVLRKEKEMIAVSFFIMLLLLIFASSLMYAVEYEAQPETFSSIPETMWWAVAALTTVGYGDMYPITPLGKFLGAVIAVLGIGMFALPAGVLASGFIEEIQAEGVGQEEGGTVDMLERLCRLKEQGHLTDEEFTEAKQRVIEPK